MNGHSNLLTAIVLAASVGYGQAGRADVLALYNFTGSVGPNSPAMGSSHTPNANWTTGTFTPGSGLGYGASGTTVFSVLTPVGGGTPSNLQSWVSTGTVSPNSNLFAIGTTLFSDATASSAWSNGRFFSFWVKPEPGTTGTLTDISFDVRENSSASGANAFAVYANGVLVGGTTISTRTQSWRSVTLSQVNGFSLTAGATTTFSVVAFVSGTTNQGSVTRASQFDNITLNGVVVPEPSTLMLAGLGISSLIPFAMRRLRGRRSFADDDGSSSDENNPGASILDPGESQ